MTDKPIIFSGPMLRALLDGRKTQTRRILKPQPDTLNGGAIWAGPMWGPLAYNGTWPDGSRSIQSPPYAPGDRLYVREAHYLTDDGDEECVVYAEDQASVAEHLAAIQSMQADLKLTEAWAAPHKRLRPSIHMPRWASRITLAVTNVRVQRLQDITEADAVAEGVDPHERYPSGYALAQNARSGFVALWNSIHGPDAWNTNPWVVAVTFTVANRNIDAPS